MDDQTRRDIDNCISDLRRLAARLEDAASEVSKSISGMETEKYTNALYDCAAKYRYAIRNLERLR